MKKKLFVSLIISILILSCDLTTSISSSTKLYNIELSSYSGKLTPEYDPEVTDYTIYLSSNYTSYSVEVSTDGWFQVPSGNYTDNVIINFDNLIPGEPKTSTITVEAHDGKTFQDYTFTVITGSSQLESISLDCADLYPAFDPFRTDYRIRVPDTIEEVTISAESFSELSTVSFSHEFPLILPSGLTTIVITLTDPKNEIIDYEVEINRTVSVYYHLGPNTAKGTLPPDTIDRGAGFLYEIPKGDDLVGPLLRDGINQSFFEWNSKSDGSGLSYTPGQKYPIEESLHLYPSYTTDSDAVGKNGPAGGYIIYDAGSIQSWGRYIESSRESLGGSIWGTYDYLIPGANETAFGTGAQNTTDIIMNDPALSTAALICSNYSAEFNGVTFDDWFLPSYDELKEMITILDDEIFDDYEVTFGVWTSTQYSLDKAFTLDEPDFEFQEYVSGNTWKNRGNDVIPFRYF